MNHGTVRRCTDKNILSLVISVSPPERGDRHQFKLVHVWICQKKGHLPSLKIENFDLPVCASASDILVVSVELDTEDLRVIVSKRHHVRDLDCL